MQGLVPIDAALALSRDISTLTGATSAPYPLPEDLGDTLPFVAVQGIGGRRLSLVVDSFSFDVGCYAIRDGAAQDVASRVAGAVTLLATGVCPGSTQWLRASIDAEPYCDPDPRHPTLARWTLSVSCDVRAKPEELLI